MFKKILFISVALLILAYLVFSVFFLNPRVGGDRLCTAVQVEIADTLERHYLNREDILKILERAKLSPVGKNISSVKTEEIIQKLEENRLIKKVNCYKTIGGDVMIKIEQRIPILRIFSDKGNYFIDNDGEVMPPPRNVVAYLPVASGSIDEDFAREKLYGFVRFLQKDKFWNAQIEQIHVTPNQDIELIPRVGNHRIILGKIDDYKENLEKLRLFYGKGLNKIGWNRYSVINLKYKNQVVCTKAGK